MQSLKTRIIQTHDTQANWEAKTTFIPKAGEIIVYDVDAECDHERFKIGDGVTLLQNLPFIVENTLEKIFNIQGNTIYADAGRITDYEIQSPNT